MPNFGLFSFFSFSLCFMSNSLEPILNFQWKNTPNSQLSGLPRHKRKISANSKNYLLEVENTLSCWQLVLKFGKCQRFFSKCAVTKKNWNHNWLRWGETSPNFCFTKRTRFFRQLQSNCLCFCEFVLAKCILRVGRIFFAGMILRLWQSFLLNIWEFLQLSVRDVNVKKQESDWLSPEVVFSLPQFGTPSCEDFSFQPVHLKKK